MTRPSPAESVEVNSFETDDESALFFYAASCEDDVANECVVFSMSCGFAGFEITTGTFSNAEIADWLLSSRVEGEYVQGSAVLVVDQEKFPLYPTAMTYSDMDGTWEITMQAVKDSASVWARLVSAQTLSVNLENFQRSFAFRNTSVLRTLSETCAK